MNDDGLSGEWSREGGALAGGRGAYGDSGSVYDGGGSGSGAYGGGSGVSNDAAVDNFPLRQVRQNYPPIGAASYPNNYQNSEQFNQYSAYGQEYSSAGAIQSYATDHNLAQAIPVNSADYQQSVNSMNNSAQPRVRTVIKRKKSDSFAGMIVLLAMSVVAVVFMGLFVWSYLGWHELKTSSEKIVSDRVEKMKREVKREMAMEFEKREKEPNRTFSGPVDYGELSFAYPKTWSSYVAKEATSGGDFEAYFKPGVVPPVKEEGIFALRVRIVNRPFDKMVESLRGDKKLKMSTRTVNGRGTNYYDGESREGLKIRMVLIKLRDKTAVIRTDAEVYREDFEKILKTVRFKE